MSLFKSGILVSFNTLISRIAGYVRDIFIASYLGTSHLGDIFAVAYRLPNFFRALFAEGAFSSAFVPSLSAKIVKEGKDASFSFASNIMTILLIFLSCITLAIYIFLPQVMLLMAPGYVDNPEKFSQLILASSITLPYMIFICLCSLITSLLNSHDKFFMGSFLPILANLIMIFFIVYLSPFFQNSMIALCYGVMASGAIQFLVIFTMARSHNKNISLCFPRLDNDVKKMLKNMLPSIVSSGIVQINLLINTIIASTIDGAMVKLYYAESLSRFPLAIIGTALATVLLPKLSLLINAGKNDEVNDIFTKSMRLALVLSLPACFGLFTLSEKIITVLFERGAFTHFDTIEVAKALNCLALGLPAFIMQKILAPRFLAKFDTKTPMKISFVNLVINLSLGLFLVRYWQHVGVAFATAASSWVSVICYFYLLNKEKEFFFPWMEFLHFVKKILFSCFVMAFVIYFLCYLTDQFTKDKITNIIALISFVTLGGISYFASLIWLRIFKLKEIINLRFLRG